MVALGSAAAAARVGLELATHCLLRQEPITPLPLAVAALALRLEL